jgi:hypothetical protein
LTRIFGYIPLVKETLDADQVEVGAFVDKVRRGDLQGGLADLRAHHRHLPRQPYLSLRLREQNPSEVLQQAKGTLQRGFSYGGHPTFALVTPIDWAGDPYGDRNWSFALNAWQFLRPVTEAYSDTQDAQLADFARRIVLDWIDQCVREGRLNEFTWYDMAVGKRAAILAVVLDESLRNPEVSDRELLSLLFAARMHAAYLAEPPRIAWHSNHGIHQLAGLLALVSTVPELRGAPAQRDFASHGLAQIFFSQFLPDACHREHTPVYHFLTVNQLKSLLDTGWLKDQPELHALFQQAADNIAWMVHPTGTFVRVGDADLMETERRLLHDHPSYRFVLTRGREGQMPQDTWAVFPQTGYAAFRSPWNRRPYEEASFLFFSAAFHFRMHKHADDFTFEWAELGRVLVCDSGRFAYHYQDPRRKYVESTRAHNTVEIDGLNYSRRALDAFGSALKAWGKSNGAFFVEAAVLRKRFFRTEHSRILLFRPGQWVVVADELSSRDEHDFTQWFHFDPSMPLRVDGVGFRAEIVGTGKDLLLVPLMPPEGMTAGSVRGQEGPRFQGWASFQPNSLVTNYAAGFALRGKQAKFVTLLRICEAGSTVTAPGSAEATDEEGRVTSQFRWLLDGRLEGFDYVTDGTERRLEIYAPGEAAPIVREQETEETEDESPGGEA